MTTRFKHRNEHNVINVSVFPGGEIPNTSASPWIEVGLGVTAYITNHTEENYEQRHYLRFQMQQSERTLRLILPLTDVTPLVEVRTPQGYQAARVIRNPEIENEVHPYIIELCTHDGVVETIADTLPPDKQCYDDTDGTQLEIDPVNNVLIITASATREQANQLLLIANNNLPEIQFEAIVSDKNRNVTSTITFSGDQSTNP